nr:MAG TPA: hypothetical protein [Caudoviricetes sp.]
MNTEKYDISKKLNRARATAITLSLMRHFKLGSVDDSYSKQATTC